MLLPSASKTIEQPTPAGVNAPQFGSDVIGFGETLHRRMPAEWKKRKPDWDEEIRGLDADISVSFEVKRSGLLH